MNVRRMRQIRAGAAVPVALALGSLLMVPQAGAATGSVASAPVASSPSEPSGAPVTAAVYVAAPRVSRAASHTSVVALDLIKKAEEQRATSDYDGEIATLDQAIHADGRNADLYADMADALSAKGRIPEALKAYTIAVGDDPNMTWSSSRMDDGDLQLRFALLLVRVGTYDQAAAMYKKGYESLATEGKKALPGSFGAKDLKSDKNGARAEFLAAVRTLLGLKYSADGFSTEAEGVLQSALQGSADYAPADLILGNCLSAEGKKAQAVALWQKAALGGGGVKKLAEEALAKAQ